MCLVIDEPLDFHQLVVQNLYFREEIDHRAKVQEAHAKTFSWIFERPQPASPVSVRS